MFGTGLPGEGEIGAALSLVLRKRPGPGLGRAAGRALPLLRLVDAFQVLPKSTFVTLADLTHVLFHFSTQLCPLDNFTLNCQHTKINTRGSVHKTWRKNVLYQI